MFPLDCSAFEQKIVIPGLPGKNKAVFLIWPFSLSKLVHSSFRHIILVLLESLPAGQEGSPETLRWLEAVPAVDEDGAQLARLRGLEIHSEDPPDFRRRLEAL